MNAQGASPHYNEVERRARFPFGFTALDVTRRRYESDAELIRCGRPANRIFILQEGWAYAYRSLTSGARQVTSVFVAGDLVGFKPVFRGAICRADATVRTAASAQIAEVGFAPLRRALAKEPMLAQLILEKEAQASALLQERLVSLGRRSARGRTAHFFLELSVRVSSPSAKIVDRFACPLSPNVVADALGLSTEHLNRILRHLRLSSLLQFQNDVVAILDRAKLEQLADVDR